MKRFWAWVQDADSGARVLYLDGVIAEESWYADDITPAAFKAELFSGKGDITIWLNSPGGCCIAASRIYALLMDYPGNVTVKIDGIAASAASVIAMAGTTVLMAPTALLMCHNPFTIAIGDGEEMRKAMDMLAEVKESIINSYEIKTGLPRDRLSELMDAETWLSAYKAIEMGFADGMLQDEKRQSAAGASGSETYAFSRRAVANTLLDKIKPRTKCDPYGVPIASLDKRLSLITH